jgi:FlaA1/EpsC-like NDP-sugar epimerase
VTVPAVGLNALIGSDWLRAVERRRSEISQRIAGRTDVVLFGAGPLGRQALRDLTGSPFTARAFVDNSQSLWGSKIEGLEVLGPDEAAARFGQSALWLITIYTNSSVIE